ncbi:MAG: hypothetical protein R2800_08125 [Flavipsychrobacter sp.]
MKHLLLYILLLIGTTVIAQPYYNISSDWCKMGLKGKVKEMKQKIHLSKDGITQGYTLRTIQFSNNGQCTQFIIEEYENGQSKRSGQYTDFSYLKNDSYTATTYNVSSGQRSISSIQKHYIRHVSENSYVNITIYQSGKKRHTQYEFNKDQKLHHQHTYQLNGKDTIHVNEISFTYDANSRISATYDNSIESCLASITLPEVRKIETTKKDNKGNAVKTATYLKVKEAYQLLYTSDITYTYYD